MKLSLASLAAVIPSAPWARRGSVVLLLTLTSCVLTRTEPDDATSVAASRSPKLALQNALGVFDGTSRVKPGGALMALRAQRDDATGNEHELIKDMIPILERAVTGPQAVKRSDYAVVKQSFERMSALYPDDFDVQLQSAAGSYALSRVVGGGSGEEATNADAQKRALALTTRFPVQARAHAHRGRILADTGGDALDAMRAYAHCRELDAAGTLCKRELSLLAAEYTRARCRRFDTKRFALHAAHDKAQKGARRMTLGDQLYYMQPKPALTGADVSDMQEIGGTAGQEGIYRLWLTPRGAGKFAALTETLAREQGYLIVMVSGHAVQAPRVMSAIESGEIQVSAPRARMDGLCRQAERNQLPTDIARALK
jgi:hypothetical protein